MRRVDTTRVEIWMTFESLRSEPKFGRGGPALNPRGQPVTHPEVYGLRTEMIASIEDYWGDERIHSPKS